MGSPEKNACNLSRKRSKIACGSGATLGEGSYYQAILQSRAKLVFLQTIETLERDSSTNYCDRKMKAAVYHTYGLPDVVRIEDVEKPVPKDHEVLIRVRAASINPLDAGLMKGKPHTFRLLFGLGKPRLGRPGVDVAGEVEAVGRDVNEFKPGDAVFGSCRGAFAEYACARASQLVRKPGSVTFLEAAAAPVAALTALQGLRDQGKIRHGSKVLIHGAAGGVGTF